MSGFLFQIFRIVQEEIRLGISGNLCRCTGYDLIVESIKLASQRGEGLWK